MRLICIKVSRRPGSSNEITDGWITKGRIYDVIGIIGRGDDIQYRVLADDGITPALQASEYFEVIESEIPPNWIFRIMSNCDWELTPSALASPQFWTLFFDGDAEASDTFKRVLRVLNAFPSQPTSDRSIDVTR